MGSQGRLDETGDPGSIGRWKDGFNLDCGLPGTLLVSAMSKGPWAVVENVRAPKNRFYVVRLAGSTSYSMSDVVAGKWPTAWVGALGSFAWILAQRFNGWESAKDVPQVAPSLGRQMP